ncbi:hypothetical protein [Streptomyces atratus]|uniref:hypothetical protein n=1 Tax=Streptomyces atratus TaxID=1893 RepID=UPI0033D6ED53
MPAGAGHRRLPAQLADGLLPGALELEAPVYARTGGGAGERAARVVVVAIGPQAPAARLPGLEVPRTRTVTTYHHAAVSPLGEPTLLVDAERASGLDSVSPRAYESLAAAAVFPWPVAHGPGRGLPRDAEVGVRP